MAAEPSRITHATIDEAEKTALGCIRLCRLAIDLFLTGGRSCLDVGIVATFLTYDRAEAEHIIDTVRGRIAKLYRVTESPPAVWRLSYTDTAHETALCALQKIIDVTDLSLEAHLAHIWATAHPGSIRQKALALARRSPESLEYAVRRLGSKGRAGGGGKPARPPECVLIETRNRVLANAVPIRTRLERLVGDPGQATRELSELIQAVRREARTLRGEARGRRRQGDRVPDGQDGWVCPEGLVMQVYDNGLRVVRGKNDEGSNLRVKGQSNAHKFALLFVTKSSPSPHRASAQANTLAGRSRVAVGAAVPSTARLLERYAVMSFFDLRERADNRPSKLISKVNSSIRRALAGAGIDPPPRRLFVPVGRRGWKSLAPLEQVKGPLPG